ncbi:MAG TPA: CDP-diacylglycerol--glycerol-3-phosphate 3-phosphatidyltransferase [Verrucomicrobiales bacterium]|nr:CDP-diacylglycerol--glycerol-3-phosphate 3-phosphatidyltransferase [Pedosphaera sp.]MBL6842021.1 CDP-diacylglycerol--glycerol-3-phosphate 3-phosphatidyltransferase [Verrucomicrobiae bacterium]RZO67898.1 MAG: CDP-diacylglycerol--glycerol-3-phosphate 3-phosphatidyltransferase [Limisphaerales bacterium]HAO65112.1 CDP-diacylglycerol--glycerol-3-phosphate 3-phosphatidyltransferase [Verrucomicrobiales bacterium]HAR00413.1 CDP-diacylglycerol--glycerol-3-phosphate 3-phosphatidyltransferase [Verrucom
MFYIHTDPVNSRSGQAIMNIPNQLTVARFVLTVVFLAVLFSGIPYHYSLSLILFGIASLTDYLDGKIARRDNLITDFGKLMDPLADKILTGSAFIAFVGLDLMSAWMVIIIVARELAITGLRLLAASKNIVLAAERFGKHKTISQITAILSVLLMISYPSWGTLGQVVFGWHIGEQPWIVSFTVLAQWVTVSLTFYSGMVYLWKNREIYLDDM